MPDNMIETTVTYDYPNDPDGATWGYWYNVLMDDKGVAWFHQEAVEQYAMDVDECDGMSYGVHLDRDASGEVAFACYWEGNDGVIETLGESWEVKYIDGHNYWAVPQEWRAVTDAEVEATNA